MAGGKGGSSPPAAPDPVATANAQTASNVATAKEQANLNRINQFTPQGSITYQTNPQNDAWVAENLAAAEAYRRANGTLDTWNRDEDLNYFKENSPYKDTYNMNVRLSPEQQRLYDLQTQGQTIYGDQAVQQLNNLGGQLSTPFQGQPYADRTNAAGLTAGDQLAAAQTQAGRPFENPAEGIRTEAINNSAYALRTGQGALNTPFEDPASGIRTEGVNNAAYALRAGQGALNTPFEDPASGIRTEGVNNAAYALRAGQDALATPFVDPTVAQRGTAGDIATGAANAIYGAAGQPINTDYNAIRQQSIDAANSRLNPQFAQDEEAMRSRLLASGIGQGSAAWDNEYRNFNNARNDARMQSILNAENLTGQAIQQTGALRGIPLNELAQAQAAGTNLAGVTGALQGQALNQYQVPWQNAAQLGALAQNTLGVSGAAQGQALNQYQVPWQNAANLAGLAQGTAGVSGTTQDQAAQQYMLPISAAGNVANIATGAGNLANQGFAQAIQTRNQPLNETSALLTGGMLQNPQLMNAPQVNVAPTDVIGSTMGAYNAQMQAYNAQQQQRAASLGGMYGLAGNAIMGGALLRSDRRLKTDINRVGETEEGTPIYTYRYRGDPSQATHMGVMAQELKRTRPDAVHKLGGFYAVDYSKVA